MVPQIIRRIFSSFRAGMKTFGEDIATLVNTILLFFVYIIGAGITAIVAKLVGKHFLDKKPKGNSYWRDVETKTDEDSFYKQF